MFTPGRCQSGDEEEDEDILVEEDLKLNAARCFSGTHATREIYQRNSRDKRLPREACFDLGDVKVEMKRRMKTSRGGRTSK